MCSNNMVNLGILPNTDTVTKYKVGYLKHWEHLTAIKQIQGLERHIIKKILL